jgi:UDP-N-acetylmuramate--alanine ligase
LVADAVPAGTALVQYVPSLAEAPKTVVALLRSGDLVMTMGAGDVTMLGPQLLDLLQRGRR